MRAFIVSWALDTNGQNARYVQAAQRYGADMRSLIVGKYDPAAVGGRYKAAADKIGTLEIRSAHRSEAYFNFPWTDIRWDHRTFSEVRQLARMADVIHLNNSHMAARRLMVTNKPFLLHHHGTLFRNKPGPLLEWAYRNNAVQAVSTVDLMKIAPDELTWLPTAYDMDDLWARRKPREPDGKIRIVSAPTNREWKSTVALETAVRELQADKVPVELVLVERKTWAECMAVKATADMYFDQVILGYGCNAIEAWGMGIPVIAGADEWTLDRMRKEFNGPLPFYSATVETIGEAIRKMVKSKALREKWAEKGREHALKFHAERPALARLAELYVRAVEAKRPAQVVA